MCIIQKSEVFPSLFEKTLGRETYEIKRKVKSELSVKNELNEQSEKNMKYLVRENKQGMREIKKPRDWEYQAER